MLGSGEISFQYPTEILLTAVLAGTSLLAVKPNTMKINTVRDYLHTLLDKTVQDVRINGVNKCAAMSLFLEDGSEIIFITKVKEQNANE